jgi:AsmA-like C-terminal region
LKITSGQVEGEATLALRLVEHPKPSDIQVDLKAGLRNLVVDDIIPGEKLDSGQFRLNVERGALRLTGTAQLFGSPAQIEVRGEPGKPQIAEARLTLDDAQRARRGFDLRPFVTGPMGAVITLTMPEAKRPEVNLAFDLARAKVEGGVPGFLKRPGQPGKVSFDLVQRPDGVVLEEFALDLSSVAAQGRIELTKDHQLAKAEFSTLKLSPRDAASARFERMPLGVKISIRGNSFDFRPFLRGLQSGKIEDGKNSDLDLDLQTTVLLGFNNELISGVEAKAQKRGGRLTRLDVKGRFGAEGLVISTKEVKPEVSTLQVDSVDAGALVRFMDLYPRMQGGTLTSEILVGATSQTGLVVVRDFVLRDEPALRGSLGGAGGSQDGAMQAGRLGRSSDVAFTKMRLDFTRNPGRLTLKEAVMWGPTLGGALEGVLDYEQDKVDLKGSFVPAYALNNLFAQVPIFGQILIGSQYEGLFAVPFLINGKASAPVFRTNPISAIAPGFLRKFFEIQREQTRP